MQLRRPVRFQFVQTGSASAQDLCVENQYFVPADIENIDEPMIADGLVGFGFGSWPLDHPTPFSNFAMISACEAEVFSFWFNQDPDDPYGGKLTLCGIDDELYWGDVTYVPMNTQVYRKFIVDSIVVTGFEDHAQTVNEPAIAETSTPFIAGPNTEVQAIYGMLGLVYGADVNCNSINMMPPIKITIGGRIFTIMSSEYVLRTPGSPCTIGIIALGWDQPYWILGTST